VYIDNGSYIDILIKLNILNVSNILTYKVYKAAVEVFVAILHSLHAILEGKNFQLLFHQGTILLNNLRKT